MAESEKYAYNHFAKPADVFKHLILCEVMSNEQPKVYLDTNSAFAHYHLDHTPEQEYGIYSFINRAVDFPELCNSKYYELEKTALKENNYWGSPALAMSVLGDTSEKFYFFDIEKTALKNITEFTKRNQLIDKVQTINQDSVIGVMELLPVLPKSTLLHIDPYNIDKPSTNGKNYLDCII